MDKLLRLAALYSQAAAIEIDHDVIEDLETSMGGCLRILEETLPDIKDSKNSISQDKLTKIRDFTGNLALLCNMILTGDTEEDKMEAIRDITTGK